MATNARILIAVFVLFALFGALSAGVSTYDFVQHLDRQVHGAHCSFIPGLGGDHAGSSGCDVALMSPYSSLFRTWVWGGLPVSLPGFALFAFLVARGAAMSFADVRRLRTGSISLVLWSFAATLVSIVMGSIAFFELETLCKSCLGIYIASFVCFGSSLLLVAFAWDAEPEKVRAGDTDPGEVLSVQVPAFVPPLAWGAGGVFFVLAPCLLYLLLAPDFDRYAGTCGTLADKEDRYGILVPLQENPGGIETIEVFDPLCPACRALEKRLVTTGQTDRMNRKLVLFPLDASCNWMLSDSIHPGACLTSEAILCSERPADVVEWAFAEQETILETAKKDGDAGVKKLLENALPEVKGCVGTHKARQRLNRSLRWSVNNSLKVLTPQLFIDGVAVCEEDSDLGLDRALSVMLDRAVAGTLAALETP